MGEIVCKTCDRGTLVKKRTHRLGGIVATIGYIFLIPSVLGIAFGALLLMGTGSAAVSTTTGIQDENRRELLAAGIPADLSERIVTFQKPSEAEKAGLSAEQRRVLEKVEMSLTAGTAGAAIGGTLMGGTSIFLIVSSFCGGLLGWILILKKDMLQCSACGATVAAS